MSFYKCEIHTVTKVDGKAQINVHRSPTRESALSVMSWCRSPECVVFAPVTDGPFPYWRAVWDGRKSLPMSVCVGE